MTRLPLLLVLALATLPCVPAWAADAPTVEGVVIEGNRRVEIDAIKAAITSVKPGRPLDLRGIDDDIKSVMKLGFFSDVVVEEKGDAGRPTVVFRVVEKPAVADTRVEGNDELSKDDLKETIEVKQYSILDLTVVKKSLKKIQDKYIEKGFYLAEVSYKLEEKPDNQVAVVFVVNEHAKVQVKSIQFLGLRALTRDQLLGVMQTAEGNFLSFFSSAGTYREDMFQHDLAQIQGLYQENGYITVRVEKPSIALSADKRFLYITLRIEEGEQYRIGKIDFSGEMLHDKEELQAIIQLKSGEILVRSKLQRDLFAVADVYRDDGYAYANVVPDTKPDPKRRIVDVTYDIQPGKKVYFERIDIAGNTKTRDKVIRREVRVYEGELFSQAGLNRSKARVTALGYFETVNITTEKGSADDRMVAKITVKEKSTGTFQLGAGFSSYENFILTGQISQNNFLGWGQTLSLQVQWSSIRQLGQIQFVDPYFLDTKFTFAFDVYATEGYYVTFRRRAIGGAVTWGYELNGLADRIPWTSNLEDMRFFMTYTNEYVKVTPSGTDIELANRFRSGTTSAVRFSLQWDKRDNRLFPSKGHYQNLSVEVAPPLLAPSALFGSRVNNFVRYTVDSRWYYPLFFGVVARAKIGAGLISAWNEDQPVPISELYYLGGINSVRGYRLLSVAPTTLVGGSHHPESDLVSFTTGGNKQVTLNTELEVPIFEKLGIRGVVFFDMGNAFPAGRWNDPAVALSLYKSAGFGFRWLSPLGPLRFEWAIPLNRRQDPLTGIYLDSAVDFQFTIGNFF